MVGHKNFVLHLDVKAMYSESTPVTELIRTHGPIADTFTPTMRIVADLVSATWTSCRSSMRCGSRLPRWVSVEVFDYKPDPETITVKSIEYMQRSLAA